MSKVSINFLVFLSGFGLIVLAFILLNFRIKRIKLSIEDYGSYNRFYRKFNKYKEKFLKWLKVSEDEVKNLYFNLFEKILRRIRIEALKLENWTNKKLENLKKPKEEL